MNGLLELVGQIGDELRFQARTVKRSEDEPDKRVAGWPNAARVPSRVESLKIQERADPVKIDQTAQNIIKQYKDYGFPTDFYGIQDMLDDAGWPEDAIVHVWERVRELGKKQGIHFVE